MKKRLLAIVLVLVMVLAVVPVTASAAFSARSTDPGLSNTTYNSGNPYPKKQCTWYAWGRYKELCGVSLPSWGNGENWYSKAKSAGYPVGDEPKLGAIACWDSWNHVAIVEQISGGNIYVSQYNRQGKEKFGGLDKYSNGSEKKDGSGNNIWTSWEMMGVNGSRRGKAGGTPSHYIYLKEATPPAKTFTVTFDPNGGSMAATKKTFTEGKHERIGAIPTPTRTGYEFEFWTVSSAPPADGVPGETTSHSKLMEDSTAEIYYDGVSSGYTAYARWFPCEYTIVLDAAGGSTTKASIKAFYNCSYGLRDGLPTPTRDGYTFDGWYTSASGGSQVTNNTRVTTTGNQTLYAHWTAIPVVTPDCSNGHTWGEWDTVQEADCELNGKRQRFCTVCGEWDSQPIAATGHNYKLTDITATEEVYTCSRCGDSYTEKLSSGSSSETGDTNEPCQHEWSDWTIHEYCDMEGWKWRICEKCGEWDDEDLPPIGHDWQLESDGYYRCTQCNATDYTREPESPTTGMDNFKTVQFYYSWLFDDVDLNAWYYDNVSTAYELGLMKGTGSGTFSPGNNVTLAETITLAARIHKIYLTNSDSFASYDGGNWYDPYVDYARENNIINTYYTYSRPATREEFVHILAKALPDYELTNTAGFISFADSSRITYLSDVRLLSGAGVINGVQENGQVYFKPDNAITRAEVAAVVGRMVKPSQRVGN